ARLSGLPGRLLASPRQRTGPGALCGASTAEDLLRGRDVELVLRIRVACEQLGRVASLVVDPADRVASAASEADDLDIRPHLAEHLFELGVDPAVFKCGGTPFPGENVL